jgi:hypothetical protein
VTLVHTQLHIRAQAGRQARTHARTRKQEEVVYRMRVGLMIPSIDMGVQ